MYSRSVWPTYSTTSPQRRPGSNYRLRVAAVSSCAHTYICNVQDRDQNRKPSPLPVRERPGCLATQVPLAAAKNAQQCDRGGEFWFHKRVGMMCRNWSMICRSITTSNYGRNRPAGSVRLFRGEPNRHTRSFSWNTSHVN